jgi:hypothetical protein
LAHDYRDASESFGAMIMRRFTRLSISLQATPSQILSVLQHTRPSCAVLIRPIHAEKYFYLRCNRSGILSGSAEASAPAASAGLSVPRLIRSGDRKSTPQASRVVIVSTDQIGRADPAELCDLIVPSASIRTKGLAR